MIFYSLDADGPLNSFLQKLEAEGKKVTNVVITSWTEKTSVPMETPPHTRTTKSTYNTAVIFVL